MKTININQNQNYFQCSLCKGVFQKGWSEEEMEKEAEKNGFDKNDSIIVCDDCYTTIMKEI